MAEYYKGTINTLILTNSKDGKTPIFKSQKLTENVIFYRRNQLSRYIRVENGDPTTTYEEAEDYFYHLIKENGQKAIGCKIPYLDEATIVPLNMSKTEIKTLKKQMKKSRKSR